MLVLSRKPLQRIQIGESIVVSVVRIDGNSVRLGIEAPSDVRVFREELLPKTAPPGGHPGRFESTYTDFSGIPV